jgi:hypothetical protein
MGVAFKYYKRKFRNALQPLFVMLIHRKVKMDHIEWRRYVQRTMTRVKENPQEFLGVDIPSPNLVSDIVDDIFFEFIKTKDKR